MRKIYLVKRIGLKARVTWMRHVICSGVRMELNGALVSELESMLGKDAVLTDDESRLSASRDYAWLSPVLTDALPEALAEVVVFPKKPEEVCDVLQWAYRNEIPVTPRSRGTGNYGQAVPLQRGVVMDFSKLNKIISVGEDWIYAEAGVNFMKLEAAAREVGRELAIFPSTMNSYLSGFICGGAGGTGSVENGFVWDGNVAAVRVADCVEESTLKWFEGEANQPYLHAYGTTGLVVEAKLKLLPARNWTALFASLDVSDWKAATELGVAVMKRPRPPRLLSIDPPAFRDAFPAHEWIVPDRISLRIIVEMEEVNAVGALIEEAGGRVHGTDAKMTNFLTLISYNHVTLRAKQADPGICHIQVGGDICANEPEAVCSVLPESRLHLDGMKVGQGVGYGGLLISRYVDKGTLYAGMDTLRKMGCYIVDPHTWELGIGHFPPLDLVIPVAEKRDPKGLLNPGKLPRRK